MDEQKILKELRDVGVDVSHLFSPDDLSNINLVLRCVLIVNLHRPEVVEVVLRNGYHPRDCQKLTFEAVNDDHYETVHLLLQYGASVHYYDDEMCIPAAYAKNDRMLNLLVYYGSDWKSEFVNTRLNLLLLIKVMPKDWVRVVKTFLI